MLIFFPFLRPFAGAVLDLSGDPGVAVAWAHLVLNLTIGILFLATMDGVEPRLRKWLSVPSGTA